MPNLRWPADFASKHDLQAGWDDMHLHLEQEEPSRDTDKQEGEREAEERLKNLPLLA